MSASMKWRHVGHLQLIIRTVSPLTVVAQKEVCQRAEMANPPDMKVFALERHELLEDLVYFRTLCDVQSSPLVFVPNHAFE